MARCSRPPCLPRRPPRGRFDTFTRRANAPIVEAFSDSRCMYGTATTEPGVAGSERRADQPSRGATRDAVVMPRRAGVDFPPDVLKTVTDRVYAVWSSIPPGDRTITVSGLPFVNERAIVEKARCPHVTDAGAEIRRAALRRIAKVAHCGLRNVRDGAIADRPRRFAPSTG